jgi:L-fuconolactonase
MDPWREQIKELAASPNVMCKVSGMVTEAKWRAWKPADFRPYLDIVTEAFGYDRLMFGSDWPVCLAAAEYAEVVDLLRNYYGSAPQQAQQQIFGDNAARFYGIEEHA